MIIKIKKSVSEELGKKAFTRWGLTEEGWGWRETADLNLARLNPRQLDALTAFLTSRKDVRGVGVLLLDIAAWRKALTDDINRLRMRTVQQCASLLIKFLQKVPGHRVYTRFGEVTDAPVWLSFFVNKVEYHPENTHARHTVPAMVEVHLVWEEFGGRRERRLWLEIEDIRGYSIPEMLARKGYYPETGRLREGYLAERARFCELTTQVGKQYYAVGSGTDDLDGNPDESSWHKSTHTVQLERDGGATRVVIDVFYEDPKTYREDRSDRVHVNPWFWETATSGTEDDADRAAKEDEDPEEHSPKDSEGDSTPEVEVPIHPFAAVFDLSKHLRLRVHVNYLTEYVYDHGLADKLVLPDELKHLVTLLIDHNALLFQDIIKGKSGGAVVLLAGRPGTGKTLTAEVYAEAEGRALYSVQCSQLGTEAAALEDHLLVAFSRARRWNAVMLLDEADVYVHERGRDMQQNAIVGVFLRVLEYQASVLFLTTNRPDDVDDAIASRCIAKLTYPVPTPAQQRRIWRILANASKITIADAEIARVSELNPALTGRDVKNLLKLAKLTAGALPVTAEHVEFVKRFKPTGETTEEMK